MRILFIGQAPSRETDGLPPFVGKCGAFLASLMGLTQEEMLIQHDFVNVFDRWPGKGIGGDKFPFPEATHRARDLWPQMKDRAVVLLGSNVARAFGARQFQYLQWYEFRRSDDMSVITRSMAVVPHPSGVNRWFNSASNRESTSKFLRQLHDKEE